MYVCVCVRARAHACQRIHDEIHDVCGLGDSPLTNPWLGFVTLPWTIGLGSSIRIALSGRQASILRDFGHACEGPRPWAAARFNAHMRDWLFWRYCCCEPMMLPGRTMRSQPMAYIRIYVSLLSSIYYFDVLPAICLFNVPISLIICPSLLFNCSLFSQEISWYNSIYQSIISASRIFWYNNILLHFSLFNFF